METMNEILFDGEKMEEGLFDGIVDESLITREQLSNLEGRVRDIYDKYSSLDVSLNDGELKSLVNLLRKNFDKFIEILGKLNESYEEYIEKKDVVDSIEGYKYSVKSAVENKEGAVKNLEKLNEMRDSLSCELLRALGWGISTYGIESQLHEVEAAISFYRLRKMFNEGFEQYLNSIKLQLYSSLGFKLNEKEDSKILKNYERSVKKFEYNFEQLKKYVEKIILLGEKIEKIVNGFNNPEDDNEGGNNDVFNGVNLDVLAKNEKNIPEELKNVFDELEENKINSSRLRTILQKIYNGNRIILSKFIYNWILRYNLTITPEELKSILGKVFVIREEKEESAQLYGEINAKEVVVEGESDRMIDSENQDLKDLNNIYNKLKNKEVESREFYLCFFGILKKYLSLKINDEDALIKQFKSFEKHNYFYRDILYVSENIVERNMKPIIITKNAKCAVTGKVIKFPIGLHSKVRLIIADDNEIVGLYSHADYIRYFGWSRENSG